MNGTPEFIDNRDGNTFAQHPHAAHAPRRHGYGMACVTRFRDMRPAMERT
ncbi:MAG TPA: hypothetical protein VHX61_09260 [Rhizomicrobium sp.]|jgi:hypothetical protein|nr:hypothetical protein [Rhizomicrobium sp.]